MKIIFLDIDGVLNCKDTREIVNGWCFVEDRFVQKIKQIVDATGAELVLSSAWRDGWDEGTQWHPEFVALCDKLAEYGMKLIDKTGGWSRQGRGVEIATWISKQEEPVEAFVILDDMDDMWPFMENLVQTSGAVGITDADVKAAIAVLGEKYE